MPTQVSIVKCRSYDENLLLGALRQALEFIGGIHSLVKKGDRVLLKPNLLCGKSPEKAVTTHPAVIKAVIQIVQEAGGIPLLGDSPGIGSAKSVSEKAGIKAIADSMGCPIIEFDRPVRLPSSKDKFFKSLEIDRSVLEADVIINLPKWKTHGQMFLTLGVKNLFGCVPGRQKALWHLKAGDDSGYFARMLIDIYTSLRPALTVLDGIVGMQGNGPNTGKPVRLGLILASRDALGIDQMVCDLLQIPRNLLPTNRAACERGLGMDEITARGENPAEIRVDNFEFPAPSRIDWRLPGFIKNAFRNALSSKPVIVTKACRRCDQCAEICPTQALKQNTKGLIFDYNKCIRCFCCQEICPEGAIITQPGWVLKLKSRRPCDFPQ